MQNKRKNSGKKYIPFASRFDVVLYISFACLGIALIAILSEVLPGYAPFLAISVVLMYLLAVAFMSVIRNKQIDIIPDSTVYNLLDERGSVVFKNTSLPIVTFNIDGCVLWCNNAMRDILDLNETPIGRDIAEVIGSSFDYLADETVTIGASVYRVECFNIAENGNDIHMLMLNDVSALLKTEQRYSYERLSVAYIAIDNVEDVFQYVQKKFGDAVSDVDDKIKAWAKSLGAIIKTYDTDKYIMFVETGRLKECISSRFSILDEIRDTRVGDSVSITVSIGIASTTGTLLDREQKARDAFDLALQRGGDQVVYINDSSIEYYGGKTKSVYKRSNIKSRTFANHLTALLGRSDNVIVMGHRYGDFDSFGASIGIARLAMLCGVKVNIAIDLKDKNLQPCVKMMQSTELYEQVFVDNTEGLDLIGHDTVVILVDHDSIERAQFADIAEKAKTIVIVDHHRKNAAVLGDVAISYIEPSASSTCELVAEMLETAVSSQKLLKEEANMLLAGILLDTKQFTRNTGTRTFGAAQYLRGAGANPADVYNLFKTAPEDLAKEARFHTTITTYNGNIAISCCDGETDESYRVIASKAADKMLSLQGIDAAFALVGIGGYIHISGRSNGTINVQLILEKLNGGGHFDVAGAQVGSDSMLNVLEKLKISIDEYLESLKGIE